MPVEYKDYYKILGVSRDASIKEIKQVYKKLARQYHPDVNKEKGAEEKFKEINEAYEVLSDEEKKKKYDELGRYWKESPGGRWAYQGGFPGAEYDFSNIEDMAGGGDFSDFFNMFFGESSRARDFSGIFSRARRPAKGEDLNYSIEVSLQEAYFGCVKLINFVQSEVCRNCNGSGSVRGAVCSICRGRGEAGKSKRIEVKIPVGVVNGSKIRLKGEGNPGPAGPGNLYLEIKIRPHNMYELKGRDIYADVPVTVTEAVLGSEIKMPYLKGVLSIRVPPLTQTGKMFRLSGQGMPVFKNSPAGNLYLKAKVVIPGRISEEEKNLYVQLNKLSHENPRANRS